MFSGVDPGFFWTCIISFTSCAVWPSGFLLLSSLITGMFHVWCHIRSLFVFPLRSIREVAQFGYDRCGSRFFMLLHVCSCVCLYAPIVGLFLLLSWVACCEVIQFSSCVCLVAIQSALSHTIPFQFSVNIQNLRVRVAGRWAVSMQGGHGGRQDGQCFLRTASSGRRVFDVSTPRVGWVCC